MCCCLTTQGQRNTSLEAQGVAVEEVHVDQEREAQLAEEEHAGDKAPDLEFTKNMCKLKLKKTRMRWSQELLYMKGVPDGMVVEEEVRVVHDAEVGGNGDAERRCQQELGQHGHAAEPLSGVHPDESARISVNA